MSSSGEKSIGEGTRDKAGRRRTPFPVSRRRLSILDPPGRLTLARVSRIDGEQRGAGKTRYGSRDDMQKQRGNANRLFRPFTPRREKQLRLYRADEIINCKKEMEKIERSDFDL